MSRPIEWAVVFYDGKVRLSTAGSTRTPVAFVRASTALEACIIVWRHVDAVIWRVVPRAWLAGTWIER